MVNVKRVGLTGGRGFIGSAVKSHFFSKGIEIIDYDCDLRDIKNIESMFLKQGYPDVVVHLAGRYSGDTNTLLKDNLLSTVNLLSALTKHPNIQLVYGSSGAVYGNSGPQPINESTICKPNTDYGLCKSYCEQAILYYESCFGLGVTLLRFPSVYGINNSKGIIYNWVKGALSDKRIVIHGNGHQKRSFINVIDICEAIYRVADEEIFGTFNVSHSEIYSLNELARVFQDVFKVDVDFESGENLLESMVLDSSKLHAISGWKPMLGLKPYLESCLNSQSAFQKL